MSISLINIQTKSLKTQALEYAAILWQNLEVKLHYPINNLYQIPFLGYLELMQ